MEQEEAQDLGCRICGSDICCDPARVPVRMAVVFMCKDCGASVTVLGPVFAPPNCCGHEMFRSVGGLW